MLFLNPRPTREEIGADYPSTYYPEAAPRQAGDLRRTANDGRENPAMDRPDFYGYPASNRPVAGNGRAGFLCYGLSSCGAVGGGAGCSWAGQGRVLDVGCGSGGNLAVLQEQGWKVSGVDANAVAVAQAQARFGERVRQGDLASMAHQERTFDGPV
ncbi:MAG: class I SAM-dependent methyltransferase [Nitrospira sp.]|nr:class I SAM-dependent methyltransferase [Nitrospira sp.]